METAPIPGMTSDDTQVFPPSDAPIINAPDSDDAINQLPDDIDQFMVENKIKKNGYVVHIKQKMSDGKKPEELPGEYENRIPTLHDIGSWFGPGEYIYSFSYKTTTAGGGKKTKQLAEYPFSLGHHWADTHKNFKRDQRIKGHQEYLRRIRDEQLESMLEDPGTQNLGGMDGLDSLKKAAGTLKELGVDIGGSNNNNGGDAIKLMLEQGKMIQEQSRQDRLDREDREDRKFDKLIKLIGLVAPIATPYILEKLKSPPPADPMAPMQGAMKMIGSIIDFKQDLTPEKESFGDKVFNIMEDVAPLLLKMAQDKGTAAAAQSPLIKAAKESENFKKVTEDQVSLHYLIDKMYKAHGAENCSMMLETLGIPLKVDDSGQVTPIMAAGAKSPVNGKAAQKEPEGKPGTGATKAETTGGAGSSAAESGPSKEDLSKHPLNPPSV